MTNSNTKNKRTFTVLIVEDDRFLNKAYADKLGREGFEVMLATSADEAKQHLARKMPSIILLDIIMPYVSGFEFLQEIKQDPKYKKIPILIISNLSQEEDIKKGKQLGAVDFIVKTDYTLDEIIEKVKEIINSKKAE